MSMALAGISLVRLAMPEETSALATSVFGTVVGLALGRLGLALVMLNCGPDPIVLGILFLSLVMVSIVGLWKSTRSLFAWNAEDRREGLWLLGMIAAVNFTIAVPYWGVGRETRQGYAFTPHFNRDYMNHTAVTAEVARGLPPENPYFAGTRLHYYWGFHIWPAALELLSASPARQSLNTAILPTVDLFVASLLLWVRLVVPSRPSRYLAVGLGLFAYSYIGPLFLLKTSVPEIARHLPIVSARDYSFLSHSWFRDFLYEPHAVTALGLFLAVLFLSRSLSSGRRPLVGLLIGICFGTMMVTDAFVGMVGVLFFAVTNMKGFLYDPPRRSPILVAAAVVVLFLISAFALGIFPQGGSGARVAIHPAAKYAPLYLTADLGALFIIGVIGFLSILVRREALQFRSLFLLLALSLFVGFTVQVPVEVNIILRKSLKIAQIPLTAFAAVAFVRLAGRHRKMQILAAMVVLPALTSLGTDITFYLDLVKTSSATTYVSRDELAFLQWIRINTPSDAVFLVGSSERMHGDETPLLIESLGERRTYYGNDELPKMFHAPAPLIARRKAEMEDFFSATQSAELERVLHLMPSAFIYLDKHQSNFSAYQELESKGLLHPVHEQGRFSLKRFESTTK